MTREQAFDKSEIGPQCLGEVGIDGGQFQHKADGVTHAATGAAIRFRNAERQQTGVGYPARKIERQFAMDFALCGVSCDVGQQRFGSLAEYCHIGSRRQRLWRRRRRRGIRLGCDQRRKGS